MQKRPCAEQNGLNENSNSVLMPLIANGTVHDGKCREEDTRHATHEVLLTLAINPRG